VWSFLPKLRGGAGPKRDAILQAPQTHKKSRCFLDPIIQQQDNK